MTLGNIVEIVMGIDDAYCAQAGAVIQSICESKSPGRRYRVSILTEGLSPANAAMFARFEALHGVAVDIVDVGLDFATSSPHIARAGLFRLMAADRLPLVDRAVYLDADLIVQRDIAELYDTPLEGALVAAVTDTFMRRYHQLDQAMAVRIPGVPDHVVAYLTDYLEMTPLAARGYFNSGVMLMNLAAWRAENVKARCAEFAASRPRGFVWLDQDILNSVIQGRVRSLDKTWNVLVNDVEENGSGPLDPERAAIIHYAGEKPWNGVRAVQPGPYLETLARSPFGPAFVARKITEVAIALGRIQALDRRIEALDRRLEETTSRAAAIERRLDDYAFLHPIKLLRRLLGWSRA